MIYKTAIIAILSSLILSDAGHALDENHDYRTVRFRGLSHSIAYKYRESGRELVLFIHGLGCSKESFYEAWDAPDLKKYSLLAIDLPGFGESSQDSRFSYSMDDHAGVTYELLRRFRQRKVHIVGHSMGGAVAVILAKKNTRRFVSLMNVDGCLGSQNVNNQTNISPPSYELFSAKLEARIAASLGTPNEKGLVLWYEWSRKSDPEGFTRSDESLIQWARSGKIIKAFLDLPVKKTYFYPQRGTLPRSIARVRNVKKIMIPGTGHFIMNDNPEEFYTALARELVR